MDSISLPKSWHRFLLVAGLIVLVVGLPLSPAMMSIGVIWLSVNFLWEGQFKTKWSRYIAQPAAWLLTGVYLYHVFGLIWTENIARGFHDLRIKLPLLALPIVFSASRRLNKQQLAIVLKFFLASCALVSSLGYLAYFGWINVPLDDSRNLSLFIDHIRFSLYLVMAILSCFYLLFQSNKKQQWVYLFLVFYLFGIIVLMRAGTALFVLGALVLLFIIGAGNFRIQSNLLIRLRVFALLFLIGGVAFIGYHIADFYTIRGEPISEVEEKSKSGNFYVFDELSHKIENGYHVNWYVQEKEMEATWNQVSAFRFDGVDKKNNPIKATLKRYLTSKGLRKDREGVLALSKEDIDAIESGIANVRFLPPHTLGDRMYQIVWEMHGLRSGHNPQGNSVGQRFLFWEMGLELFAKNWLFGVGTGDVKDTFDQAYENIEFYIHEQFRHRAHNQYITIGIAFGIIGVIYFITALISPFVFEDSSRTWFFTAVSVVLLLSMLNEDTLETQAGATLFAFWWSFVLWAFPKNTQEKIVE